MTKLIDFIKLIRMRNILITLLIQILIKFSLINVFLNEYALNNFNFILYISSLLLIVSAGYIINDIYDIKTDKINKPERIIDDKKIKKEILRSTN